MSAPTLPHVVPDPAGVEWCEQQGIDWARLQDVLEWVEAHPERHNQRVWAKRTECGTAACLAGWTVMFAGIEINWEPDGCWEAGTHFIYDTVDGVFISDAAAHLLGLDEHVAKRLFDEDNTVRDLWEIASEATLGAVRRPVPEASILI